MKDIGKLLETLRRLKSERPEYFKWLGNRLWILTAISLLLWILETAKVYTAPGWVEELLDTLPFIFASGAAATHLPVKDPDKAGITEDSKYKPK